MRKPIEEEDPWIRGDPLATSSVKLPQISRDMHPDEILLILCGFQPSDVLPPNHPSFRQTAKTKKGGTRRDREGSHSDVMSGGRTEQGGRSRREEEVCAVITAPPPSRVGFLATIEDEERERER